MISAAYNAAHILIRPSALIPSATPSHPLHHIFPTNDVLKATGTPCPVAFSTAHPLHFPPSHLLLFSVVQNCAHHPMPTPLCEVR